MNIYLILVVLFLEFRLGVNETQTQSAVTTERDLRTMGVDYDVSVQVSYPDLEATFLL